MYPDDQRRVFKYYDGEKEVYGDPLALRTEIFIATNGDPDGLSKKVFTVLAPDTPTDQILEAFRAQKQIAEIVMRVFNMKPFDPATGSGATIEHCHMTWRLFGRFLAGEKKNTVNSPTESPSTAGPQG
jgi:hypothetical protein